MEQLLAPGAAIDVETFNGLAASFQNQRGACGDDVRRFMSELNDREDFWLTAHRIFLDSQDAVGKFLAATFLLNGIRARWNLVGAAEHEEMKSVFFRTLCEWPANGVTPLLLDRLNMVVIEVMKYEWPGNWKNFILDLIDASNRNQEVCKNSLKLLQRLSEEICECSVVNLTVERVNEMKSALESHFLLVFAHIKTVMGMDVPELRVQALETLAHFLVWVDLKLVFRERFCQQLVVGLLPIPVYQVPVLNCFSAIASHQSATTDEEMVEVFNLLVQCVAKIIPSPEAIDAIANEDVGLAIVKTIAAFLAMDSCAILQGSVTAENSLALEWMVRFSDVVEDHGFVCCMDLWHEISQMFVFDSHKVSIPEHLISPLQEVLMKRMVRPQEFSMILKDGQMALSVDDSVEAEFYESMKETLSRFTSFRPQTVIEKLLQVVESDGFTSDMMPYVYSIGAISGSLKVDIEQEFLTRILSRLLKLMEMGLAENDQLLVAASFVFIASQHTRFLFRNQDFLHLTMQKVMSYCVLDFHPIQVMALNALKFLATRCYKPLVSVPSGSEKSFIQTCLGELRDIMSHIPLELAPVFYESLTILIANNQNQVEKQQMMQLLFQYPLETLNKVGVAITPELAVANTEFAQTLASPLNVLAKVISVCDQTFQSNIEGVIGEIMKIFDFYSAQLIANGRMPLLVLVKAQLFSVIKSFLDVFPQSSLVPNICNVLLRDFQQANWAVRFGQSLECFSTIIVHLGTDSAELVKEVLLVIVGPVSEFVQGPDGKLMDSELRFAFFQLLSDILTKVYTSVQYFDPSTFSNILDSILCGLHDPQHKISEISLNCVSELLSSLDSNPDVDFRLVFHNKFFLQILTELFAVLTDNAHNFMLGHLIRNLHHMLQMIASGQITLTSDTQTPSTEIVARVVAEKLHSVFPTQDIPDLLNFSQSLLNESSNLGAFHDIIGDFLISVKKASLKEIQKLQKEPMEDPYYASIDTQLPRTSSVEDDISEF